MTLRKKWNFSLAILDNNNNNKKMELGAGSPGKGFRGKGSSIQKSDQKPLACSQWIPDILRNGARNNVKALTAEFLEGLEGGKLKRAGAWKRGGWLWAWMNMKVIASHRGSLRREVTLSEQQVRRENLAAAWLQGSHARSREASEEWIVIISLGK